MTEFFKSTVLIQNRALWTRFFTLSCSPSWMKFFMNAFQAFMDTLPEGILRAKGILYLQEDTQKRHIFQLVGKRWSLKTKEKWDNEKPSTKLVMIGLSGCIDSTWLERKMKKMSGN